jgi:hypothetical protein
MLQAALGLGFDISEGTVVFDRPVLPSFLDTLDLRDITLGDGALDIRVDRGAGGSTSLSVLARRGDVGLKVEL